MFTMRCGSPVLLLLLSLSLSSGGAPAEVWSGPLPNYFGAMRFEQINCTPPTIDDFPPDMFDQDQRQNGAVVVHFLLTIYAMLMIGVVIDEYFVPCLEILAKVCHMTPNIAGATLMAIGTSSPELFINIVGTFITQGDIGVGTIVGSAVFNILAAPASAGLATGFVVALEWWPLTRDCTIYGVIVIALGLIMLDGLIYWWEALILVLLYGVYLLLMYLNRRLERVAAESVKSFKSRNCCKSRSKPPSVSGGIKNTAVEADDVEVTISDNFIADSAPVAETNEEDGEEGPVDLLKVPDGSLAAKLYWFFMWPGNLIFFLTVPDVRRKGIWKRLYLVSFLICVIWIGSLTYLVTWFITVIGYTLGIPDSAMGITFLAAGSSVPEAVATVVVARQGQGSMGISNSVGSNSFDILVCMGLPWLIKAIAMPEYPSEGNFVVVNSRGVVVSVGMLFITNLVLYFSVFFNKFNLDRKIGAILLITYMVFLVLAGCLEMNVFFPVNPPPCE